MSIDNNIGFLKNKTRLLKSRKAMSPLIATVLLIAFAVALGAMIMNWSSSLGEQSTSSDCSSIFMEISPYLCYAENMIRVSLKNTGDPVESVTLSIVDDSGKTDKTLPNSQLLSGDVLKKDLPFITSGKTSVSVLASIKNKDQVLPCDRPVLEVGELGSC